MVTLAGRGNSGLVALSGESMLLLGDGGGAAETGRGHIAARLETGGRRMSQKKYTKTPVYNLPIHYIL